MVVRDIFQNDFSKNEDVESQNKPSYAIANPYDRFAAWMIDFTVLFLPIYTLAVAPLKKEATTFYLTEDWGHLGGIFVGFVFLFFMVYVSSQLASRLFFGGSLGKKILGLKVLDLWTEQAPSYWTLFLRSFLIVLQFLTFGFSFLLVLSNRRHRGLHDQLCDTFVVNIHGEQSAPMRLWPIRLMLRGSLIVLLGLLLPLGLKFSEFFMQDLDFKSVFESEEGATLSACEKTEDLEQAMALVASGHMETECLKDQVDLEFVEGANPTALGYLAKSFLYVDQPELSDLYLEKVCSTESGSAACVLAQFISGWSDGKVNDLTSVLEEAKDFKEPFLTLWALRYFQQIGLYEKSIEFSKDVISDPRIGIYVKTQVLKAKYMLKDVQGSDSDLRKLASTYNSPVVMDTKAWSCLRKIESSCQESGNEFCRSVAEVPTSTMAFQPRVLLSKIRLKECESKKLNLQAFEADGQTLSWRDFVYALEKEKKGDHRSAWKLYGDLVRSPSAPDYLKYESIRRMSLHPDLVEVGELGELVSQVESYEYRRDSANHAIEALSLFKQDEIALKLQEKYNLEPTESQRLPASLREGKSQ